MLKPGETLDGRYEVLDVMAAGGMGEVYRARRVLLGDEVAIKVIRGRGGDAAVLRERFLRESRLCAQLRHPHIVSILDFAVAAAGDPYLVMEHLNGASLREELAGRGPMAVSQVQEIVEPVCGALQMAHDRGIVHRDLKPANIVGHRFASGDVVYKVIDFGLANLREDGGGEGGEFAGTVSYASPEQLQALDVDARADIYSLGAVVYEMLTGHPPYEAATPLGVITKHLCDPVPSAGAAAPGRVPEWLDAVVVRALAKEPGDRWATMAEFARALHGPSGVASGARDARPSELLAKYDVGPIIATGRLGSRVHSGTHRALGLPVAIRLLRRQPQHDWEAVRARFLLEARELQVSHPSVIQVRDFGEEDDCLFVVTDLIEGRSLLELLDAEAPLAWPRVVALGGQVIEATVALHRKHALVCGLNPGIVRMTTDEDGERLMISTGGIGQVQQLLATAGPTGGASLTASEIGYLAPEVLAGAPADVRADVFTVGVILYEMATGVLPFRGRTVPDVLEAVREGPPRDPRAIQPGITEAGAACLIGCLAADPAARIPDVAELRRVWRATA